jgi:hypothetical protein
VQRQRDEIFDYVAWEVGRSADVAVDERTALLARVQKIRDTALGSSVGDDTRDAGADDAPAKEERLSSQAHDVDAEHGGRGVLA